MQDKAVHNLKLSKRKHIWTIVKSASNWIKSSRLILNLNPIFIGSLIKSNIYIIGIIAAWIQSIIAPIAIIILDELIKPNGLKFKSFELIESLSAIRNFIATRACSLGPSELISLSRLLFCSQILRICCSSIRVDERSLN